ncbi:MAG: DegT/DnrJ/EryC1/StrS family aminotransferase [Elusimicrobia bacterium]|nr:DegT/DnrJ/EryC1/StrS family aminotransferase [Elusimicrobiota bacterium]
MHFHPAQQRRAHIEAHGRVVVNDTHNAIPIVEDTAEGLFSKRNGKLAGTFGTIGCFSFQATKTITTGEGGFVLTDDPKIGDTLRLYREHGMRPSKRYWHEAAGFNFRLSNLQCAVGCAQLERVGGFLKQRKAMAKAYYAAFASMKGVTPQYYEKEVDGNVWAVAVKLDKKAYPQGRDKVIAQLAEAGIESRPGFYPFSVMPLYQTGKLPVSEDVGLNVVSVPSFPSLTAGEIGRVCDALKKLAR